MNIKPLTPILFGQNQPYTFDTDTKTLPELCALLHGKMNETVEAFNDFALKMKQDNEAFMLEAKGEMQKHDSMLRQEFQDFIDTVDLKVESMEHDIQNITFAITALTKRVAALESKVGV